MIDSSITLFRLETIVRTERQRKLSQEKVIELAQSISQRDLIHTIVVQEGTNRLISGEHRLEAFLYAKANRLPCPNEAYSDWTYIPGRFGRNVSEDELVALELEENIKRHDLSWQEETAAIKKYHELKVKENPEWTGADTARLLGISSGQIYKVLIVANEFAKGNERVTSAATFSAAYNICARALDRALDSEINLLEEVSSEEKPRIEQKEGEPSSEGGASAPSEPAIRPAELDILQANFLEWIETYSGPRFNLIHCDFPYGINHQKSEQGRSETWGEYEDSPEVFWTLFNTLFERIEKVAYPSAHIMFWFSMNYYQDIFNMLAQKRFMHLYSKFDLRLDPFPLIWHKSDNKGLLPDPERGPRRIYETALLMSLGDRKIVQAVSNLYSAPTSKEFHLSEKPESVLRHFFRMLVDEHTELLDPTCGSGTALRAAEALGAKRVLGLELDPSHVEGARIALDRSRRLRVLSKITL